MKVSRRSFLKSSALALPLVNVGCRSLFDDAILAAPVRPSALSRVNLAVIGCGTQGFANMICTKKRRHMNIL